MLLSHVLGCERIGLYMDLDRPVSELERAAFRDLVERAVSDEPVQYLVGEGHFYSMRFEVNREVLIPRPCTEMLVEHVVEHSKHVPGHKHAVIADIGTGSGCIGISIAKHLPDCHVVAVDISEGALGVARRNAERHGVMDRMEFRCGDLYEGVKGERFDFVVSNPPYISDAEWEDVEANVKDYEPEGATRGGEDGLAVLRPLIGGAREYLKEGGQLVVEIAASQGGVVKRLVEVNDGLREGRVLRDFEGHERMLLAERG